MLTCGPWRPVFKAIEEEAVCNLVLWCDNNEDHIFADDYTSHYDPDDPDPAHWLSTNWPARIIYDKLFRSLCSQYVPNTLYHSESPWRGRPSNSAEAGATPTPRTSE